MTRADDLRADLVRKVNEYILDNLDPGLDQEEDEAILEAGDIVDLVLEAAYQRTRADLDEIEQASRCDVLLHLEATQRTWFKAWPATFDRHQQERRRAPDPEPVDGRSCPACGSKDSLLTQPNGRYECAVCEATGRFLDGGAPGPDDRPPVCVCASDDLYCEVHDA